MAASDPTDDGPTYDWVEDDSLTREEVLERFNKLKPARVAKYRTARSEKINELLGEFEDDKVRVVRLKGRGK